MNAGEINISVAVDLQKADEQFRKVEEAASAAGQNAGRALGEKVSNYAKFGDLITKKFAGPGAWIGVAESIATAINTASEKGIGAGLEGLVNSLPVIGTAYRLGESIGNAIWSRVFEADQVEKQLQERAAAMEARMPTMLRAEKMRQAEQNQVADQLTKAAELERKLNAETARAAGDERQAAFIEAKGREDALVRERDIALGEAMSDRERTLIEANHQRAVALEQSLLDQKYAEIDRRENDAAARRQEEAERLATSIAERERKDAEALAKQQEKDAEALRKREAEEAEAAIRMEREKREAIASIEEERIASAQAGVSTAQTALGAFKFDAYPQDAKKRNDERIISILSDIRSGRVVAGAFT